MLTTIAENKEAGDLYRVPSWVDGSPLLKGMSIQVSIVGPDGIMRATNLASVGRVDVSDRPHFRYHLDPAAPQPYISVPVIGRNSGKWSIQITRRMTESDGSFAGVIVVSLDPFYFSQFFESVDLGRGGVVDLIGRDGIVRARRAHNSEAIGQNVGDTALFKHMQRENTGTETITSKLDGVTRVYGFAAVPDYPLIVAVGLALDDVLAPVRRQAQPGIPRWRYRLDACCPHLELVSGLDDERCRERELTALADQKTAEQRMLLDTAVNNMRHGLLMFDDCGRAVSSTAAISICTVYRPLPRSPVARSATC